MIYDAFYSQQKSAQESSEHLETLKLYRKVEFSNIVLSGCEIRKHTLQTFFQQKKKEPVCHGQTKKPRTLVVFSFNQTIHPIKHSAYTKDLFMA